MVLAGHMHHPTPETGFLWSANRTSGSEWLLLFFFAHNDKGLASQPGGVLWPPHENVDKVESLNGRAVSRR